MDIQMAEVTAIVTDKVKVKFNQDDIVSALEYPKLISYSPKIGDKVLMLKTNTSYICLGGIGATAEEAKEDIYLVGEYKFFAKDKGLLWNGWAKCDGREISRSTLSTLFAEIGTTFGIGNGSSTFNLPNTTERVLADAGLKVIGTEAGEDTVTLTVSQMPKHSHWIRTSATAYTSGGRYVAQAAMGSGYANADQAINETGSGDSHENRQPTLYGGYYYIYTGVM